MLAFIITIVKLLAIILVVATIHEFGHFLASKLLGVGVDEFAIGFGPKIFQKKYKGTMYSLRWLPLGGYCAIEGEEPQEDENGELKVSEHSYQKKNPLEKIVILAMGVIFNFILATIVFIGVNLPGNVGTSQIDSLREDSVLIEAGIQVGDTLVSLNGKKVELLSQIEHFTLPSAQTDMEVQYVRDGQTYTTLVKNAQVDEGKIGISFTLNEEGDSTNEIEMVGNGTSAAKVGIKSGDVVISVDGVETNSGIDIVNAVKTKANQEVKLVVLRNGEQKEFTVVPKAQRLVNLGIASVGVAKSNLRYAFMETWESIKNVVLSYANLFTGKTSLGSMSGIVGIGEVVSKSEGVLSFFFLMAMISMAVGVANILPFPPLDGGKIVLVLIEAITRKKVPEKVELAISYVGLFLLLALTIFVSVKDVIRII